MKISIVTNAFNQGRYLAAAMTSVLTQVGPEVEYIVVDPGSTDETPNIIRQFMEEFPGRIIHIQEADQGPADGLNKGFARATGSLLGYLNADDLYLPGCFEGAVNAAMRFPRAAAVYGDGYKANFEGKIVRRVVSTSFSPRKYVYGGCLVLQQSTFYRAEAFRAVGGFNFQNKTSWDAEILLDMTLRKLQVVHVPGYWAIFRIHSESITGSQRLAEEYRKTNARCFQKVIGRPKNVIDQLVVMFVKAYSLLAEPRSTAVRILDRLGVKAP